MATTTRLLRPSNEPLGRIFASSSSWPSSSVKNIRCVNNGGKGKDGENKACGSNDRKKTSAVVKASAAPTENVVTSKPQLDWSKELTFLLAKALRQVLMPVVKPKPIPWKLQVQMLIEKVIINSRFFTIFAVGGSLIGSILCFMEGCFLILGSYLQYFHTISVKSDQEHITHLLIEAIDIFLVGTAMLIFGMGLYMMFVGSKTINPRSNLFGLFHLRTLPAWVEMKSVSQAKSKIGHAVMMILQVGVLEKFKSVPLVTSLDLACFAGAIFVSSASILLLSKLSVGSFILHNKK